MCVNKDWDHPPLARPEAGGAPLPPPPEQDWVTPPRQTRVEGLALARVGVRAPTCQNRVEGCVGWLGRCRILPIHVWLLHHVEPLLPCEEYQAHSGNVEGVRGIPSPSPPPKPGKELPLFSNCSVRGSPHFFDTRGNSFAPSLLYRSKRTFPPLQLCLAVLVQEFEG